MKFIKAKLSNGFETYVNSAEIIRIRKAIIGKKEFATLILSNGEELALLMSAGEVLTLINKE